MICRGIINAVTIAIRVICAATPASANLPHRTQSPQSPTGRETPPASSVLHPASWQPIRPTMTAHASGLLACSFGHLRRTHGQFDFWTDRHTGTTGKHGQDDEITDCMILHVKIPRFHLRDISCLHLLHPPGFHIKARAFFQPVAAVDLAVFVRIAKEVTMALNDCFRVFCVQAKQQVFECVKLILREVVLCLSVSVDSANHANA